VKIFGPLYDKVLAWSQHSHAPRYLAGLSFAESSFFPIPPDVLLAPMVLAQRDKAFRYALITTLASVAGGLFGYALGYFAIESVSGWMQQFGYWEGYLRVQEWFEILGGFCSGFFAGSLQVVHHIRRRRGDVVARVCAGVAGWPRCAFFPCGRTGSVGWNEGRARAAEIH
jgi:membrane protein YqaA with SNARE-associated domain